MRALEGKSADRLHSRAFLGVRRQKYKKPTGFLWFFEGPKGGGQGDPGGNQDESEKFKKKRGGARGGQGTRWGVQDDPEGGAGAKSMKNQWFLLLFEGVLGRTPRSKIENRTLA